MTKRYVLTLCILLAAKPIFPQGSAKNDCDFIPQNASTGGISCGYLEVPEDHQRKTGKKIKIAYAVLKRFDTASTAAPVLYLNGGPGSETFPSLRVWISHPMRQQRDIILFDQRGVGFSSALPNIGSDIMNITMADADLETEEKLMRETVSAFKKKNGLADGTLALYNIYQAAEDVGMLMDKLGYKLYSLYGVSYGTRLGMILMNKFPNKIKNAVFYGLVPPQIDVIAKRGTSLSKAFENLFEQCKKDTACYMQYPQLELDYTKAIESLKTPLAITLNGRSFVINQQDAPYLLRYQMYPGDALKRAPALINAFLKRDTEAISQSCQFYTALFTSANLTMYLSAEVFDNYNDSTVRHLKKNFSASPYLQKGLSVTPAFAANINSWHTKRVSDKEKNIGTIKIPALLLNNRFDPACPYTNAVEAKKSFANARLIIFNEYGHITRSECKDQFIVNFLNGEYNAAEKDCLQVFK